MTNPSLHGYPSIVQSAAVNGLPVRSTLRTGRVATPVPVDHKDYQAYVERCLRQWTVDVELDSGEYLVGCRVSSMQGNATEGVRRLPRIPRPGPGGRALPGDIVMVGFLNGHPDHPVVLGAFSVSSRAPGLSPEDLESIQIATLDPNESQDRLEYLDLSDPQNPLVTSTSTRTTGLTREHEHVGESWVDGQRRSAHLLERSRGGRSVETEHRVEVDAETTAVLRTSDQNASTLRSMHAVDVGGEVSSVIIEDLQAQVLSLTQQVADLSTLVLRSTAGQQLFLQQQTEDLRTTAVSDSATRTVSLLAEDLGTSSRAGWTLGPSGELVLRRSGSDNRETTVSLTPSGDVVLQTPGGATILVDDEDILVSSGKASITVSEDAGVHLATKQGTRVTMTDDAVAVMGPACTVQAETVHLKTGGLLVGDSASGAKFVPDSNKVESAIRLLQQRLNALVTAFNSHVHPTTSPGAPTGLTVTRASQAPSNLFVTNRDSLKTMKGV